MILFSYRLCNENSNYIICCFLYITLKIFLLPCCDTLVLRNLFMQVIPSYQYYSFEILYDTTRLESLCAITNEFSIDLVNNVYTLLNL